VDEIGHSWHVARTARLTVAASTSLALACAGAGLVGRAWGASAAVAAAGGAMLLLGVALGVSQARAVRAAYRRADDLAREREALRELAHTDALTGLGNRRRLAQVLRDRAGARDGAGVRDGVGVRDGARPVGAGYALLAIDLDGFKNVNDMRGHDVGDTVLVEVAQRLRTGLRPGDLPVRLGGDEFAVLMRAGLDEAERVAARLLGVLSRPYRINGSEVFLSASVGLAAGVDDMTELLRNADLALRFAKQRGKNRVERYDAAYEQWLRRRTTLEQELRGALERDELSLVYQPVLALPEERPVGAEVLLRWYHPSLGRVSPAEFIPIAAEAGLVDRLDRWVLHQACHRLSRWLSDGHDMWLSVNVSPRELHAPGYVRQVIEMLWAHGLPPERLVLEVAEPAAATDMDELAQRLGTLRAAGVRVALDDFGSGYSALADVGRLPLDLLKIDRALVTDPAGALVDLVVRLGHRLGLDVVAVGVAEPAQRAAVEAAGCRLGQGDLFFRPMPAEHVDALLQQAAAAALGAAAAVLDREPPAPEAPAQRLPAAGPPPVAGPLPAADAPPTAEAPPAQRAPEPGRPATSAWSPPPAQNLGQVDSGHEMRQA
jgi:diguanylate cyclase